MAWTVWDRWVLKGNPTLREVLQWRRTKVLTRTASLVEAASCSTPPYRRHLDVVVACEDEDDNDVDIPLVSIYF
ncbi:hypothetical protein HID58_096309, partial [Brassica napus]